METKLASSTKLSQLPLRMHHRAIVVRDQEATRHFMEDIIGMPLVATWCERTFMPEMDREVDYCHTFYALEDGSAIAFFQFADADVAARCLPTPPPTIPRFDHISLKATRTTQNEIIARLEAAGLKYRITNHGYCKSVYVTSPDGLYMEFANDPPDLPEIAEARGATAHADLAGWLAGSRETNNDYRQRDF